MWIRDFVGDKIWATEKWRELFGFEKSERLDMHCFLQRVHPADREPVRHLLASALLDKEGYEAEYRIVLPDGRIRWISARGRTEFDAERKPVLVRSISLDITQRRLAEEALQESEVRFRTMANTAPVMIWMSDTDRLCTFFNKSWLDFTGRALERELGNGWTAGVHPEDFDHCLKTYVGSFDRWVMDNGVPRFASNGTFLGYIGSAIDITERRLAEEAARSERTIDPRAGQITQCRERCQKTRRFVFTVSLRRRCTTWSSTAAGPRQWSNWQQRAASFASPSSMTASALIRRRYALMARWVW